MPGTSVGKSSRTTHLNIEMENRFDILRDFPALLNDRSSLPSPRRPGRPSPPAPEPSIGRRLRCGTPAISPAPRKPGSTLRSPPDRYSEVTTTADSTDPHQWLSRRPPSTPGQLLGRRTGASPRLEATMMAPKLCAAGTSQPPRSRPLFPPTTLIIGNSITRNMRFFNATTCCFPGATVSDILRELPGLLQSLPSSIHHVLVHIGTNETAHRQSDLTKRDFKDLFTLLESCGKYFYQQTDSNTSPQHRPFLPSPQHQHTP